MKILIFGATGMVGQAILRECLFAPDVTSVITVGRSTTGSHHAKLREAIVPDLFEVERYSEDLKGVDACYFCLGVQSAGMTEAAYTRLTFTLTLAIATKLAELNPQMTFVYISGTGTDSTEVGPTMWARVKGWTENALLHLPFKAVYMFRPAAIIPMNGERSKTAAYRYFYSALGWILFPLRHMSRGNILTTEELGQAMLKVTQRSSHNHILEAAEIQTIARKLTE